MTITITPLSPERLSITGDVEMELCIPFDGDEDRFHLAISDGTLIAGDTVTVDWRPEWVTIGVYQPVPARAIEPLPLFESA